MINKAWSRKFVAISVTAAVLTVSSMLTLATPAARSGGLSVIGDVTVNGQKVISGGTIFSDSAIVTAKDSSAAVSLSKLGRVDVLANSSMRLSFTDNTITGLLDLGRTRVSTPSGVSVNFVTKDASVMVNGTEATSFTVTTENGNTTVVTDTGRVEFRSGNTVKMLRAGESSAAGMPQGGDEEGLHGGRLAALLLAIGGAVGAIIWATTRNNDLNFTGTVNVVSPTK
jgi:hypothetical protein